MAYLGNMNVWKEKSQNKELLSDESNKTVKIHIGIHQDDLEGSTMFE